MATKVIVNGREESVEANKLTYDEVVRLAYPHDGWWHEVLQTVVYHKGPSPKRDGCLAPKESVRLKDGMIFNVCWTGAA